MRIYIDADGCPVVRQTVKVAHKRNLPVTIVKNHAVQINIPTGPLLDVITVDTSRDSADYFIANRISSGDLVVTQDYGLAAMTLAKGAYGIGQNGQLYNASTIDGLLNRRHFNAEMRRKHKKNTSKIKKRTEADNLTYETALEALLDKLQA